MSEIASIQPAMTSLEIAELVESRHDKVKQSIERLVKRDVITQPPMGNESYRDGSGRNVTVGIYLFEGERGKRDSTIVVAQLSPEFTARLVDRWQELEAQSSGPALPSNYIEALEHLLESKRAEQAALAQLEQAKPAVEFVGRFVDTGTTKTVRETSKLLGLPEKAFIQALIDDKILYRQSGNLLPHQRHHAADRFTVKTGERNGYAYTQTRVTSIGIDWLANRYGDWIGEKA